MNTNPGSIPLSNEAGEHHQSEGKSVEDGEIEGGKAIGVDVAEGGESLAGRPNPTLEEMLTARGRKVPEEEWAQLPDDLIDRLDFYTSGADV